MTDAYILSLLFLACSAITWLNVRAILRDKSVMGVSTIPVWVFITTNLFEVYYFGVRGEAFATAGSVAMFLANIGWIAMVWWYRFQDAVESRVEASWPISLDFSR